MYLEFVLLPIYLIGLIKNFAEAKLVFTPEQFWLPETAGFPDAEIILFSKANVLLVIMALTGLLLFWLAFYQYKKITPQSTGSHFPEENMNSFMFSQAKEPVSFKLQGKPMRFSFKIITTKLIIYRYEKNTKFYKIIIFSCLGGIIFFGAGLLPGVQDFFTISKVSQSLPAPHLFQAENAETTFSFSMVQTAIHDNFHPETLKKN